MAAQVSTPDVHPAEATAAAVEEKTLDARAEAIRLLETKASEPEPADEEASSSPEKPSPAGPDAETKPEPEDARVAQRIAAAKKAEMRAARLREEQAAREARLAEREAAFEARQKEIDARDALLKSLESDPLKAFEALKLDPKTFLERLAGEYDPNAVVQREIAKEREARIALEKRLDEERQAREQLMAEQRRAAQESRLQEAQVEGQKLFIGHLEANADKYPHLTEEFTPEEIAQKAWSLALEHSAAYHKQYGEYPDDSVFAEYLEAEAAKRAEARSAWRARLKKPSEPGPGTASTAHAALKPRTLTNGMSSTKSSAPKPWNERDAREEAMRIVAQMHAAKTDD